MLNGVVEKFKKIIQTEMDYDRALEENIKKNKKGFWWF